MKNNLGKTKKRKNPLRRQVEKLPFSPGVYFFKDSAGRVIYIGKAASLRDRVGSYFQKKNPFSRPIEWVLKKVVAVDFEETDSVLEAYFLEQALIKKKLPFYNVLGKDDKSFCFLVFTKEIFPRILIVRQTDLEGKMGKIFQNKKEKTVGKILGPYSSKKTLEEALKILRKIFPFHSRPEDNEKKCFDFQLGLCPGPHAGKISRREYGRNIRAIQAVLLGKKRQLLSEMEKEMRKLSRENQFERAATLRNRIFSLRKIKDISLLKEELPLFVKPTLQKSLRIEGCDISSLAGNLFVGSLVVFSKSESAFGPEKSQYRKFKIKNPQIDNDLAAMGELLRRRFSRRDWPKPDLLILDGGEAHLNLAENILSQLKVEIPLLAVAKGPERKKTDLRWRGGQLDLNQREIVQVRDEAHRFAIAYHRKIRKKAFFRG